MLKIHHRALSGVGCMLALSLGVASPIVLLPGRARAADEPTQARSLVVEGDGFYARQDYARALERYSMAYRLMHVPTVGIEVMKAQKALDQLLEANATALEVAALPKQAREPAVFDQARLQAARAGLRFGALIPTLWLDVAPRGVAFQVKIDGTSPREEAPFHLNPGAHDVQLSAHGYQTLELKVTLLEAERQTLTAVLFEDPAAAPAVKRAGTAAQSAAAGATEAEPSPSQPLPARQAGSGSGRTLGWLCIGVAGVGAAVGTFAGITALLQKPDCPDNVCEASQNDAIQNSERMGTAANISFGVAIVAGALGIWQLATSSDPDPPASAALPETEAAPALTLVGVGSGRPLQLQLSGSF